MMGIRSDRTVYQVLEAVLRDAEAPMTCTQLMEYPNVRKAAIAEYGDDMQLATNKLSDALGFMWRRQVLERYPAPKNETSLARFAYMWKPDTQVDLKPLPSPVSSSSKPRFSISETDNEVVLDFAHCVITIRCK